MTSPRVGMCYEIDREKQFERLEFSSVVFMKSGEVCRVSKRTLKATERVASGGRKPTKGHMKERGIKPPFCPSGSEPRVCEDGRKKCEPIIHRYTSMAFHANMLSK